MLYYLPENTLNNYHILSKKYESSIEKPLPIKNNHEEEKEAQASIYDSLTGTTDDWPKVALFQLLKTVEIAVHLKEISINSWWLLKITAEALRDANNIKDITQYKPDWQQALSNATRILNSNQHRPPLLTGTRESLVASELAHLESKGFQYNLSQQSYYLKPKHFRKLCDKIEQKIARVGGLETANRLLRAMNNHNRIIDGSLIHAQQALSVNQKSTVGIPLHFIYSLCLKHLDTPPKSKDIHRDLKQIECLAKGMAASLNVESHNSFEHMSIPIHSSLLVLHETIVYDELWAFPQWQPKVSLLLIQNWLKIIYEEEINFPEFNHEIWIEVAENIFNLSQETQIREVHPYQLASATISIPQAEKIADLLSLTKQANKAYKSPTDAKERNSTFYPLLGNQHRLYLQPTSIAIRAFYERFYALIRSQKDEGLETKMGNAFERLCISTLENIGCNITFKNAKYKVSKDIEGEIDIVVETIDRIFLIECKKKTLKGLSRSGVHISQLEDLNGSYLKMLEQLIKHEAHLRKTGELQFQGGQKLFLKNRKVEKIALSMLDHGSIQDRSLNREITIALLRGTYSTHKETHKKITDQTNKLTQSIRKSFETIFSKTKDYEPVPWQQYMLSVWWLSIDQLYYICHGKSGLWEGMEKIRNISFSSRDIIFEINQLQKLNKSSQEIWDHANQTDTIVHF